jgi:ribosomal protein S18 acetylase RimI-like enzyme
MEVLDRLERFYDAVPRPYARIEDFSSLVLFVRDGEGWPYYARPVIGGPTPSAGEIVDVRRRQRDLGVPEAFEWVHETSPDLLAVARSAGLEVLLAPLLVLDPAALLPSLPVSGATVRLLDPTSPEFPAELAAARATAALGFGAPAAVSPIAAGTLTIAAAGPAERDAAAHPVSEAELTALRARHDYTTAVASSPTDGILATGAVQCATGVAEVVGVATLPSARGRGYATQLTATLARHALDSGQDLVFLSASDDDIARLYTRVGFRRVGTACIATP